MPGRMDEAELSLPPEHRIELNSDDARLPNRWAVLTLSDADDRPVQLVCWKNPRQTLANRLKPSPEEKLTRRVNWQDLVRTARWRRVDSAFEADWVYLETARKVYSEKFTELVPWAETFFVHVDPDDEFPRYLRTSNPSGNPAHLIGPLPDRQSAARLIEIVEDSFDLCRYHNILVQSPSGKACAYKDMGKCPAPCDGNIAMEQYRRMIDISLAGLADPTKLIAEHTVRMEQSAAGLRFETATKIKALLNQLSRLNQGPLRYARPLSQFQFVAIQPGPRRSQFKIFLILPSRVEAVSCLRSEPAEADFDELIAVIQTRKTELPPAPARPDLLGLAARHLFSTKSGGIFIPFASLNRDYLQAAIRTLAKSPPEPEPAADSSDIPPPPV